MANDFFNASGYPATRAEGSSSAMRAQLAAIAAAFDKLAPLTGNGGKFLRVNAGATGYDVSSVLSESGGNVSITGTTTLDELAVTGRLSTAAGGVTFSVAPTYAADPASGNVLARKSYVDSAAASAGAAAAAAAVASYLPLAGGTLVGALLIAAGSAAAPGLAIAGDSNTGFFSGGADALGISAGGVQRAVFNSTGLVVTSAAAADASLSLQAISYARDWRLKVLNADGTLVIRDETAAADRVQFPLTGGVVVNAPASGYALDATGGSIVARFLNATGGAVNAGIAFGSPGSSNLSAGVAGLAQSATTGALILQYVTGGVLTEGARIDTVGQFGLGKAPTQKFDVDLARGAVQTYETSTGINFRLPADSGYAAGFSMYDSTAGLGSQWSVIRPPATDALIVYQGDYYGGAGTEMARFTANGVGFGGAPAATYGSSSVWAFGSLVAASAQLNVHSTVGANYEFVHRAAYGFDFYVNAGATLGLRVDSAGRIFAPQIHNNGSGASGTTEMLASGTYTPTLTASSNVTAATPNGTWHYKRVGNIMLVSGSANITVTSASSGSGFYASLPVASDLTASTDLNGLLNGSSGGDSVGSVSGDTAADRASLSFVSGSVTGIRTMFCMFTYEIK